MPPSEPNTPTDSTPPTPTNPPLPVVVRPIADTDAGYEHVYDEDEDDDEFDFDPRPRRRRMQKYVRVLLVGMAVGFTAILGLAVWLNPYNGDGTAKTMETHRQLGLEQCGMVKFYGKPCPACGMTTSFALLMHADPVNSAKANWVGTVLCLTLLVLVPWCAWGAWKGKLLWVRNGEMFATVVLCSLLVLMFGRWGWIMFVP